MIISLSEIIRSLLEMNRSLLEMNRSLSEMNRSLLEMKSTDLVHVLEGVDDVIREAGQQVDDEPGLDVVHADEFGVRDDLAGRAHEGGVEVEDDVDEEDDVHDAVHHQPGDVVLLGLEGHVVGHHDGGVEGEDEDHPVPRGLEEAVVQDDVRRRLRGFLLVLRQDV